MTVHTNCYLRTLQTKPVVAECVSTKTEFKWAAITQSSITLLEKRPGLDNISGWLTRICHCFRNFNNCFRHCQPNSCGSVNFTRPVSMFTQTHMFKIPGKFSCQSLLLPDQNYALQHIGPHCLPSIKYKILHYIFTHHNSI